MTVQIDLPAKLDLGGAEALLAELKSNRGTDVTLDAAGVKRFGSLGAKTILVAAQTWQSEGHSLSIANIPDDMTQAIELMGLSPDQLTTGSEDQP